MLSIHIFPQNIVENVSVKNHDINITYILYVCHQVIYYFVHKNK